ncbi:MAG: TonB-dependent receptor [Acidobacteriia bacterium]|nr:TonB-dependent receptor [Terriglobia bacterium]
MRSRRRSEAAGRCSARYAVVLLAVVAVAAYAQFRAGIQGVVSDANGGLIPDATVTLTSTETNIVKTAKTSDAGVYSFPTLAPGAYKISVEKVGFSKKVLEDVLVSAEQMRSLNVQLDLGQVTESVTVNESSVPLLDTQSAIVGGTLTSKELATMPSMARDPFTLIRLTPGVFGDGARSNTGASANLPSVNRGANSASNSIFSEEAAPQVVVNGTRQASMNIQVDGVGVNSVSWAGSAVITPNEDSIKEIRVLANNYTAENGQNSGGQILIISKNGTNEVHGSGFFKFDRPGLNAFQRWNGQGAASGVLTPVQRDNQRFNQFGASMGAPIIKNKLFAFFSYEGLRNGTTNVGTTWFETPQFRQSARSGSIAQKVMNFAGQAPFSQTVLARTCADVGAVSTQCHEVSGGLDVGSPLSTALGTKDPTRGLAGTPYGIGNGFDGVPDMVFIQTAAKVDNKGDQYNGRLDFQPTTKDLFAFNIYWVPRSNHQVNGPQREFNKWQQAVVSRSWTGIFTHTFTPTLINEARFGFSGWHFNEFDTNPQEPWGIPKSLFDGAGGVPGSAQFGPNGPGYFDQATRSARDTLNKVHNSHLFKFGGEYSRARFFDANPGAARPQYTFHSLWDYANDAPYLESGTFDPTTGVPTMQEKNLGYTNMAVFVQDDWKVRRNLTINLGLRWEYIGPLREDKGLISNIVLGSGSSTLTGLKVRTGGVLAETSKRNFGPQVGFAWSPDSFLGHSFNNKLVLRGGFGIGYNPQKLATTSDQRGNPPFVVNLNSQAPGDILYAIPSDSHQFFNWPANPVATQKFDSTTGLPNLPSPVAGQLFSPGASSYVAFADPQNTPTTYRFSLDVQYDLGRNWVATIGYQGSQTRHYSRRVPFNLIYYPNLNPLVQGLTWQVNDAAAHFNALLAEIQHRFSKSFQIDVQYRFSRLTDQGSEDYYSDRYPFDINASNGPADYDVTHNFQAWGMWTPTFFKGSHSWLEKVAGGWSLSGILNIHTGFPWTPSYNTNNAGKPDAVYPASGYRDLLPQQYLGGSGEGCSNSTFEGANGYFPKGALAYFVLPTVPATGIPPVPSVGRNIFRGPCYRSVDATLAKAFGLPKVKVLGENAKLNLQLNAFNVFNTLNLSRTPTNLTTTNGTTSNPEFGKAGSALGGRIIELQARFIF